MTRALLGRSRAAGRAAVPLLCLHASLHAAAAATAPPPRASMARLAAVGQMTSTSSHADNYAQVAELCARSEAAGAKLLCVPEAFSFLGSHFTQTIAQAQSLDGERLGSYRVLARKHKLWLSLGGFHEAGAEVAPGEGEGRVYNTHVMLDDAGATVAVYRKIHLFDVDVVTGPVMMESRYTAPGPAEAVVIDSPVGRLGLTTCYDLRFPELFTALAQRGAEVILVPSAFTVPTGKAHWHLLLRARAVETQSYVLAAAQAGAHNEKRASYGHALAVDPWGTVVADAGSEQSPALALIEIDLERLRAVRERMPIAHHRRKDVLALTL
ncbi:nitrilase-like protein 1-like protein [Pavlovales sp. CCMP2436]|nr:nitrilase-like protein 1-like protein [Pavlovales sp. CCMP2436]|mmetsp:Transcript_8095/g.20767  ORF Transcript_8095/g.20767 Transcript_8095/m.20767 type:complete len:325 (-) Transcript_8095:239-1213(-)